jgi:DNA-binding response OmpR family regulator
MRILVVEDEKKLAEFIRRALKEDGHAVDVSLDGDDGGELAIAGDYDAIVLDLQLPRRDGLSILRELRARKKTVPVVILTARDAPRDRIRGLDDGADDYVTKPFLLDELRARVRAVLRRGASGSPALLQFRDLSMNLVNRKVSRGARAVALTPRQFSLLEYFLRNPERVLTRTSIAEHVWDMNFEWRSNVVDVVVNKLRRKVDAPGEPALIHTVRGAGYVLQEGGNEDR